LKNASNPDDYFAIYQLSTGDRTPLKKKDK